MDYEAPPPPEAACVVCHEEPGVTWLCGEGWVGEACMSASVQRGPVEPPPAIGEARD